MRSVLPKWMIQLLALLLMVFLAVLIMAKIDEINEPHQLMRMTATGKTIVIPDVAIVTLGVVSEGTNSIEVKNKNNAKMNQVIGFIKQQGIEEKNIQTTQFYASPKYNYANGQNNIVGYSATQLISITIAEINKSRSMLQKIVDGAVNNGANEVQDIQFSLSDPAKFEKKAREAAIKKAREKAEELTSEADLKLGRVINISTQSNDVSRPIAFVGASMAQQKSVAPNIEPGSQTVMQTVTMTFEVE